MLPGSFVIIKNIFTRVEGKMELTTWDKMKHRRDIKRTFVEVDRITEPPEVTELKKRLSGG